MEIVGNSMKNETPARKRFLSGKEVEEKSKAWLVVLLTRPRHEDIPIRLVILRGRERGRGREGEREREGERMAMAAAVGLQIQVLKIGTQLFPEARQERHGRSSSGSASVSFRGRFDDRYGALRPCGCGNVMDLRIQFRFGHRIPDGGAGWYRGLLESRPHSLKSQVSFGKSKVSWLCRGNQQDSGFCLHDLMDQAGIETAFARVREILARSIVCRCSKILSAERS